MKVEMGTWFGRKQRREICKMRVPNPVAITLCLLLCGTGLSSQAQEGNCASQGSRFPRFALEGKPPRGVSKGPDDLSLCRIYRKRTCCTADQTNAALASMSKLATSGEGSAECLSAWEVLECSICDPRVGITPGPPLICASLCRSLFTSCRDAFFANDPLTQILVPCGSKDVVCARGWEWASNSTDFCHLAGFALEGVDIKLRNGAQVSCYDGRGEPASSMGEKRGSSKKKESKAQKSTSLLDMLNDWAEHVGVSEKVLWAIGGLVLTAGAALLRRRSINARNNRSALFQRARSIQEQKERRQMMLKSATARATKKMNSSKAG